MLPTFKEFCEMTKPLCLKGAKITLSELDLAILYVTAQEQERQGTDKAEIRMSDFPQLIEFYCGEEVFKRVFAEEET